MAGRVRRNPYELQAKLSMLLAIVGGLSVLVLCVGVFRRFSFEDFAAVYLVGSLRFYGIIGATFVGLAVGAIGFFVALNAAGHKRNPLSSLAWVAFFLNAAVVLLTLCLFVVFWFARDPVYPAS